MGLKNNNMMALCVFDCFANPFQFNGSLNKVIYIYFNKMFYNLLKLPENGTYIIVTNKKIVFKGNN